MDHVHVLMGLLNLFGCAYIVYRCWHQKPAAMFLALTSGIGYVLLEISNLYGVYVGHIDEVNWFDVAWNFQHLSWILSVIMFVRTLDPNNAKTQPLPALEKK